MADEYHYRKKGFVVFLGRGGASRFVYLRHDWSDEEVVKFKQDQSLPRDFAFEDPNEVCVLMNFFSSEMWYRNSTCASMPPLSQMMTYFPHFKPSFIILDPAPDNIDRDHLKFFFPSTMWSTEKAYENVERVELLDLEILGGEASDLFVLPDDDIQNRLERCFSQPLDKNQLLLGLDESVEVNLDEFVVSIRDVHLHYLHYMDPDKVTHRKAGATADEEVSD